LSPSAAAASRLLKPGMTLTQVFSQLVSLQEELLASKDENAKLNTYLEQILREIEERAPVLKKEREERERAVAAVTTLTEQLEEARQEYEFRTRDAADARRNVERVNRENERLAQQVNDLGKQVAALVRDVEASRRQYGSPALNQSHHQSFSSSTAAADQSMDGESIINDRLLTFHSVHELQQRNLELLTITRELTRSQEAAESQLVEEKTAELRAELEKTSEQLAELRAARQRQEAIVESIIIEVFTQAFTDMHGTANIVVSRTGISKSYVIYF
jgi:nucleoprotein TPR